MTKKIIGILLSCFLLLSFVGSISAQEEKNVNIYFFWSKTCPHCAQEKVFLKKFAQENPQITIKGYGVDQPESINLLKKAETILEVDTRWVPLTIIGNQYFSGYTDDETSGKLIKDLVNAALTHDCPDIFESDDGVVDLTPCPPDGEKIQTIPETIKIPILGKIKTRDVSLPFLTIVLGLLDGFNPCAMWALLFLISLLLGMKDRKRMWVLGTAFIITSAFVYFLFMSAWLNLFLFLGFILWARIIVGLIALAAGSYNLREYWVNKDAVCKVTQGEKKQAIFAQLKKITQKKDFLVALVGIILLAFAVNLVELICSAGLPAIYTQVLTLSNLPTWQYYAYLLVYIFFFMIDDLFVFFAAMKTLEMVGIESKYTRYSHLIGGLIMLIIGLLMIFKPELLMFG